MNREQHRPPMPWWWQRMMPGLLVTTSLCLPVGTEAVVRFEPLETIVLQDSMMADGRLSLSHFEWQGPVEDVMQTLERQWSAAEVPPMRSERDGWQVITHLDGEVIESIELRERQPGRIEGRRVRWKHDARAGQALQDDERWFRALLPARVTIQPPIRHEDGGRLASTLVALSDDMLLKLDAWIDRKLQRQGYRKMDLPQAADQSGKTAGQAVLYAKAEEEIVLTVSRQAGRQAVVLHWRR